MKCPACAEEIADKSAVCPLCRENLANPGGGSVVTPQRAEEIRARVKTYNALSFVFALPGIAIQFAAPSMLGPTNEQVPLVQLCGGVLIIIGLSLYAMMKGRSAAFGLFGFLSCLGLLFLAFLGKICQNCSTSLGRNATECPSCKAPA